MGYMNAIEMEVAYAALDRTCEKCCCGIADGDELTSSLCILTLSDSAL